METSSAAFLQKPFERDVLLSNLQALLALKKPEAASAAFAAPSPLL